MIRIEYPLCKHWAEFPGVTRQGNELCPKCSVPDGDYNEEYYRRVGTFGDLLELAPATPMCEHDFRPSRTAGKLEWCSKCGERR